MATDQPTVAPNQVIGEIRSLLGRLEGSLAAATPDDRLIDAFDGMADFARAVMGGGEAGTTMAAMAGLAAHRLVGPGLARRCYIALRDEDQAPWEYLSCANPADEERWELKGVARSVLGRVFAWQDTLYVPDVRIDETLHAEIQAYDLDVASVIGVPLGPEAGMYLDRTAAEPPFSPAEARQAMAQATLLGRALALHGRFEALHRRQANLDILLGLLSRPDDENPQGLLDEVAEMTRRIARGDRAFVLLLNDAGELTFAAGHDREGPLAASASKQLSRSVCDQVMRTRREVCVLDTGQDEVFSSRLSVVNLRLQGIVAVPLLGREGPVGLLYVDSRTKALEVLERDMQDLLAASKGVALLLAR